jgi:hypothetical protein
LSNVIRAAKKLYYNSLISNSNSKRKTAWIIKIVTGRKLRDAGIQAVNIDGKLMDHHYTVTETLNDLFPN